MGRVTLVLDSRWKVLPCLKIGVSCSCRGLDRRGPIVTGGGKGQFLLDRFSLWGIEGADFPIFGDLFYFPISLPTNFLFH